MFTFSLGTLANLAIFIPLVGALLIACLPERATKPIALIGAALSLICSLTIAGMWRGLLHTFGTANADSAQSALAGMIPSSTNLGGWGFELSFMGVDQNIMGLVFDRLSTLLVPAFVGIGFVVVIYSTGYLTMKNREHADPGNRRFYALLLTFIGGMAGLGYSSTIVGQLIFFEITGACSYGLIGYYMSDVSQHSAMKALILTHIASLGLYFAAAVLYMKTGTFRLALLETLGDGWKGFAVIAMMFAAWGKSAQLPLYMWLPSAMEAPTPVSAYLHGGSMVKVGVYVLARSVISSGTIPAYVGWVGIVCALLTLVFSFLMYLPQIDMKRLLAYSTISQLSYMFLALSFVILTGGAFQAASISYQGAVAHIFNHAFAKTLFFLVAGTLSYAFGTRLLTKITGLSKVLPLVSGAFIVAALAVAGVPPFSGFFSKFMIFVGGFGVAASAGSLSWLLYLMLIIVLIETICCFAWFLKWIGSCLPGSPSEAMQDYQSVPASIKLSLIILMIMAVASSGIAVIWLS